MFYDGNGYINNYFGFESQVEIITRILFTGSIKFKRGYTGYDEGKHIKAYPGA